MVVNFGDDEAADAFDTAEPDPVQVARRLAKLRAALNRRPTAEDEVNIAAELIAWLRREGGLR